MKLILIFSLVLAAVDTATAFRKHWGVVANVSPSRSHKLATLQTEDSVLSSTLTLRGGAGPIPPTSMAKVFTTISLAAGLYEFLLPEQASIGYTGKSDPTNEVLLERIGASLLSVAAMGVCLFFYDADVYTAVGVTALPAMVDLLRSEWRGDPERIGFTKNLLYVPIAIMGLTSYGCLTNQSWKDSAIQAYVAVSLLNGVPALLVPDTFVKSWGMTVSLTETHRMSFQAMGGTVTGVGVAVVALTQGNVDALKAFGYALVPSTLLMAYAFARRKYEATGTANSKILPWFLIDIIAIATLCF